MDKNKQIQVFNCVALIENEIKHQFFFLFRPWYIDIDGLVELEKELVQSTDNSNVIQYSILNIKIEHSEKISLVPLANVSTNSCFIVDLSKLENLEDRLCDDRGAWSESVTSKKYKKVHKTYSMSNRITRTEKKYSW